MVRTSGTRIRTSNSLLFLAQPGTSSIDLSQARRLKGVVFWVGAASRSVDRITMALRTITPKHRNLRQILIYVQFIPALMRAYTNPRRIVGEQAFGQWLDLDCLLVQFWESFSIRPKIVCVMQTKGGRDSCPYDSISRVLPEFRDVRDCVAYLLPEATRRGMIGPVETRQMRCVVVTSRS